MYISWGTDLDPKGANSQVREASDLLINHSVVPDIGMCSATIVDPIFLFFDHFVQNLSHCFGRGNF